MLTKEQTRKMLDYDPTTGIFTWRVAHSRIDIGMVAGSIDNNGYRRIKINRKRYLAHRLAWLWVYGEWPINQIDHINNERDDNRIVNLREATREQNSRNSRRQCNSKSPYKGITQKRGKWAAQIYIDNRKQYLGCFDTPEAAHKHYCDVAQKAFGTFWRGA